jgi:hypothetical protein
MRVVVVGPLRARLRIKQALAATGVQVVGEADTLAEAEQLGEAVDAFVLPHRTMRSGRTREPLTTFPTKN